MVRGNLAMHALSIADFTEALRLEPDNAVAYRDRGAVSSQMRDYDRALGDFSRALQLNPRYTEACNDLAWLRATCPDGKFRNGKEAIEHATRACQLSEWKDAAMLDTLAAAYAESGQFDQAVRWIGRALELAPKPFQSAFRSRSELYQRGKPYRVPDR